MRYLIRVMRHDVTCTFQKCARRKAASTSCELSRASFSSCFLKQRGWNRKSLNSNLNVGKEARMSTGSVHGWGVGDWWFAQAARAPGRQHMGHEQPCDVMGAYRELVDITWHALTTDQPTQ